MGVTIRYMKTAKDHIHYMIETTPNANLSALFRVLKSYTTYHIWEKYSTYLGMCICGRHTFLNDGYFIASVGNVIKKILREYINNQGKE